MRGIKPKGVERLVVTAAEGLPTVEIVEESPREGMQIESTTISTTEKILLIDALARTGLKKIVVGSFVRPTWVPQMGDIEDVIAGIHPVPGVTYQALALNRRGAERRAEHSPPLTLPEGPELHATRVHVCPIFVRRNTNREQQDEIDRWPTIIKVAQDQGVTQAGIGLNAAWGSNWLGPFSLQQRMDLLQRQHQMWEAAGINVTKVWLGDPMGWNSPHVVGEQVKTITSTWPNISTFHLHLHNTRGMAMTSMYAALTELTKRHTLVVDTSIGGIGGCPWCGNGRATGMIATEDMVEILEALGISTGIDMDALIEASHLASQIVGRSLDSHVARAGPRPLPDRLYPIDLPIIETFEQAQHFRCGPIAYAGARSLGKTPSQSTEKVGEPHDR
jgi:hydroxymethylglutaryl-CoA lyase